MQRFPCVLCAGAGGALGFPRLAELLSQVRCRKRSQVGSESQEAYETGGLVARGASMVVLDPMGWAMTG